MKNNYSDFVKKGAKNSSKVPIEITYFLENSPFPMITFHPKMLHKSIT